MNEHVAEPFRSILNLAMKPIKRRVFKAPQGECAFCDEQKEGGYFPPHDASTRCESGKRNHCTCDACF